MSDNRPELIRYFLDFEYGIVRATPEQLAMMPEALLKACPWFSLPRVAPISIGLVEHISGNKIYYGFDEFRPDQLDPQSRSDHFVRGTVIPKIAHMPEDFFKTRAEIAQAILDLIQPAKEVQIWARHGGVADFGLLVSIFGGEEDFIHQLRQKGVGRVHFRDTDELRLYLGGPKLTPQDPATRHVAIGDAEHDMREFDEMLVIGAQHERDAQAVNEMLAKILSSMSDVRYRVFSNPLGGIAPREYPESRAEFASVTGESLPPADEDDAGLVVGEECQILEIAMP